MARKIEINADGGGFTALTVSNSCTAYTTNMSISKYSSITTNNNWNTIVTRTSADADAARLTAATNSSTSPREGYGYISYTVNGNTCTNIIHLVQAGASPTCDCTNLTVTGYSSGSSAQSGAVLGKYGGSCLTGVVAAESPDKDWVTNVGLNGYNITGNVSANTSMYDRTVTIKVTATECSAGSAFTFTQSGRAITCSDLTINGRTSDENSHTDISIGVFNWTPATLTNLKATTVDEDWLKDIRADYSSGCYWFKANVEANQTPVPRTATIHATADQCTTGIDFEFTQSGKTPTCSDLTIVGRTIDVEGNIDVSISVPNEALGYYHNVEAHVDDVECDWLHDLEIWDTDVVAREVDTNDTGAERTATVYIHSDECSYKEFTVKQKACDIDDISIKSDSVLTGGRVNLNVGPIYKGKVLLKYNDGTADYSGTCGSSDVLTRNDVSVNNKFNKINHATIGNCITRLECISNNYLWTTHKAVFSGCTSLQSVDIPPTVSYIGYGAFDGTGLKSVRLPKDVAMNHGVFENCTSLTSVTFDGNSIDRWGLGDFEYCTALERIELPKISSQYSIYHQLTGWIFKGCTNLKEVVMPDNGNYIWIDTRAFQNCSSLRSINIPNTITKIYDEAFNNCSSLQSITLPSSLAKLGVRTFSGCTSLTSVTCNATTPPEIAVLWNQDTHCSSGCNVFAGCSSNLVIYVPSASVNAYKIADGWKDYASKIQAKP